MPIKPENRHHYGEAWKTKIRPRILRRADGRCEKCGKPNGEVVLAAKTGGTWYDAAAFCWRDCDGVPTDAPMDFKSLRVVLTVAHLDQNPANHGDKNLRALCQFCHLGTDREHNIRKRKLAKMSEARS